MRSIILLTIASAVSGLAIRQNKVATFSDSCQDIKLKDLILEATCKNEKQEDTPTTMDLKKVIGVNKESPPKLFFISPSDNGEIK